MAYPVKNKERHDFYYSVANPAINYQFFQQRCRNNKHKLDKQLMEQLIMTPRVNNDSVIDVNGRECTRCKQYKLWDQYYINQSISAGHHARCRDCIKFKREILIQKPVYTTESKYVSPFKVRPRKGQMMSVKDIAIMEGIDKRYCSHLRQMLYLGKDLEKIVERYKNYPQLDK